MEQKTLFEIPIYSMSEAEFNNRWDARNKKLSEFFGEKVNARLLASNHPENVWKYNQIIGYIVISVSKSDVWFDIYKSLDSKYYAVSKTKHFIQNMQVNGLHFGVNNENDTEIHEEIKDMLRNVEKDYIKKEMFIDYSTFSNVFDAIDIRRMMDNL